MHIDWTTVLASVGASAFAVGAVAWLLKTFISHELTKALEQYRQSLQLTAQVQNIRFSRLHERRAAIIHELYKRIIEIRRTCHTAVIFGEKRDKEEGKSIEEVSRLIVKLDIYFGENALYFPQSIRDKFSQIFGKGIVKSLFAVGIADMLDHFPGDAQNRLETVREALRPQLKESLSDFDGLLADLESEFRSLLGAD